MKNKTSMKAAAAAAAAIVLASAMPAPEIITKEGDTTVVNTTTLAKGVRGFKGETPLKIYIRKGKVVKIVPLKNRETPQYFNKAATLLTKYAGKSTGKAAKMKVDGVTGATYSSAALVKNVQAGLKYYDKHR